MVAFIDHSRKEIYIGYRGTCFTSKFHALRDISNDFVIIGNSIENRRPHTALKFAEDVIRKFGKRYRYINVGHSKGGSVAEFVACQTETKGFLFNPGGSILNANFNLIYCHSHNSPFKEPAVLGPNYILEIKRRKSGLSRTRLWMGTFVK